jgi:hypothetical protein
MSSATAPRLPDANQGSLLPLVRRGISRFPRNERLHMPFDHAGPSGARVDVPVRVAFRLRNGVGAQDMNLYEAQWLAYGAPSVPSAPLFANKLLRSTAEMASGAATRWCQRTCYRRAGGRNAGILAVHCLRVTIDATRERCCIYCWRPLGHRRHRLSGLSEEFCCEHRARQ